MAYSLGNVQYLVYDMNNTIRRNNVSTGYPRSVNPERASAVRVMNIGPLDSLDTATIAKITLQDGSRNDMIQKDRFESRWVLQQRINGTLSKCSEGCVGGGEDGVLLTHILKCRHQPSSLDCRNQRREAWLTHEGAHQILGRKKNRINNVYHSVAGHHVGRGDAHAPIDNNLARLFHIDAQIVPINSLDNVITQVLTKYLTTDDMVQENVLQSFGIFEESLDGSITELGESLF